VKKALVRGIGAAGAAGAALAMFGSGVASADNEYAGETYGKAAQEISQSGGSPTIATRVGSFLPTSQCTVTGSRSGNFLDSSGTGGGGEVLLYLNCNNTFAAAGVPGNSIASPEGKQARSDYEDRLAEAQKQAEVQQNESDELLQSQEVSGGAG